MRIGNKEFDFQNHFYMMGILNVTPDSFSDGGKFNSLDSAMYQAEKLLNDGADLLDVGGESTRPGYIQISEQEEIERICPVIERIKRETDVPVSLDTYKSKVASAGISAGVDLINDIWGLKYDSDMGRIIAKAGIPCCLMHNRDNMAYTSFLRDVKAEIHESVKIAINAGILRQNIILDPGVGFGKTYEQNLMVLKHLSEFVDLGYPVLLGTSRKSVIGLTLDLPKNERVEGTITTSVLAGLNRCMFVRVHDVKENYRALKMLETIMNV